MSSRHSRLVLTFILIAGLAIPGVPASARAATLEGEWVLAHQYRGSSRADQVDPDDAIHLRISATPAGMAARIWTSARQDSARQWPAFFAGADPLPVEIEWRSIDPAAGSMRARYRVRTNDEAVLRITERYELSKDGAALTGTVLVETLDDGRPAGRYVIRRSFERAR